MSGSAPPAPAQTPRPRSRALLPVALLFGSFGVSTAVAVLVFALFFDPERQAYDSFHALGLALASVAVGCLVGVTVLALATWRLRHRMGLQSNLATVLVVVCLAVFGLVAVLLLVLAAYGILGGTIGTGQQRTDIVSRAAASVLCLLVAPAGVGLALARRTRSLGIAVVAAVLVAAVASVAGVRVDAVDAQAHAIDDLPYVLPPEVTPEVVEGAEGFTVEVSAWTVDRVYELQVPLEAADMTPDGRPVDDDTRFYNDFAIMLSEFPGCGEWRDEVRCERVGEDVVVELAAGPVVAVRSDPGGGAYGIMLTDPAGSTSADDRWRRAHDLVDGLDRATRQEYEDALGIVVD